MITFKLIKGDAGYEATKELREKYLSTGEKDSYDDIALHIAGYENGKVICSGRMYEKDSISNIIDNVTVDEFNRLQYVGDTVLRAFEDKAVQMMKAFIYVNTTEDSKAFFEAEGYLGDGVRRKDLTKVRGCKGCSGGKNNHE